MIEASVLKVVTNKFPILPGEDDELVNENMYGKALCLYLQEQLSCAGINVPMYICEDWGWWVEVERAEFSMGLCVYSDPDAHGNPKSYAIMPSIHDPKKWSWSKFRMVDVGNDVMGIMDDLASILLSDKGVSQVTRHDDFPY